MSATDNPAIPPSADAECIAGAIARNGEWYGTEARDLVGALQSIADDVNSARNAGIDWGLAVTDIVAAICGLGEEVNSARCDALDAIVDILTLDDPIVGEDLAIVAWAITAGGDTLPIATTAADPTPRVQLARRHLREVN